MNWQMLSMKLLLRFILEASLFLIEYSCFIFISGISWEQCWMAVRKVLDIVWHYVRCKPTPLHESISSVSDLEPAIDYSSVLPAWSTQSLIWFFCLMLTPLPLFQMLTHSLLHQTLIPMLSLNTSDVWMMWTYCCSKFLVYQQRTELMTVFHIMPLLQNQLSLKIVLFLNKPSVEMTCWQTYYYTKKPSNKYSQFFADAPFVTPLMTARELLQRVTSSFQGITTPAPSPWNSPNSLHQEQERTTTLSDIFTSAAIITENIMDKDVNN